MVGTGPPTSATGRPPEIEEVANRLLVHPVSRAIVGWLVGTSVTPNQVSFASVFAAAAAAAAFLCLPSATGAVVGLGFLFAWHVLDGADGDLARKTNRASAHGELVDGVCDHVSQGLIYVSLGVVLGRSLGSWAGLIALAAALSHTVQANAYEAGRKTFRHWVFGTPWMRQRPDESGNWASFASHAYLALAATLSPGEIAIAAAMNRELARGTVEANAARDLYRDCQVNLVKQSGLLGATGRTVTITLSLLVGSPIWFFLFEIIVLNAAVLFFVAWRRRANRKVVRLLGGLGPKL